MLACEQIVDLIPAYALEALDQEEAASIQEHLGKCMTCRSELRAYQAIADGLPQAVPQYNPPVRVKAALMERVNSTLVASPDAPAAAKTPWWERLAAAFRGASTPWSLVSLAVILVLLAGNLLLLWQTADLRAAQPDYLGVINLSGTGALPEATGVIVVSADRTHGTLVVDRLRPLGEDQQYQLWLIDNGQRSSGGVFSVDEDGYGAVWVHSDEPLGSYDSFGITIEPYGGSPDPTGERVLGGDL
jgi:anti-sigma-K factor RskA